MVLGLGLLEGVVTGGFVGGGVVTEVFVSDDVVGGEWKKYNLKPIARPA